MTYNSFHPICINKNIYCKKSSFYKPSLGIVKIGICVIEPFLPSTRPARYRHKKDNSSIESGKLYA